MGWLHAEQERMINEFEDVSYRRAACCTFASETPVAALTSCVKVSNKEKQFMVLWNAFVHKRHIYADFELPWCLRSAASCRPQMCSRVTLRPAFSLISSWPSLMRCKPVASGLSFCVT